MFHSIDFNIMLIIVSKDIGREALKHLENYGKVVLFETQGITYSAIENHPDIYFCPYNKQIIAAPNTPSQIIAALNTFNVEVISGKKHIGKVYPQTAYYNAVISNQYLIHHLSFTDTVIKNSTQHLSHIHINQGYTRCNLLALPNNSFITSDKGIAKTLRENDIDTLYVNPESIYLRSFAHGFFGGCCGIAVPYFFINGSLKYFSEKDSIECYIDNAGLKLVELSRGRPEDIGSLFFV